MQRYSKKREAILNKLRSTCIHPSAEWVYEELKDEFPDLSLATVYRNISSFCEDGLAVPVGSVSNTMHYDADTSPHMHFICDSCGSISDAGAVTEDLMDMISGLSGEKLSIDRCELTLRGLCDKCRNN